VASSLQETIAAFGVAGPAADRLVRLAGLWARHGRVQRLLGATTEGAIARHVAEGLAAVEVGRACGGGAAGGWVDVGSGAGLPGLVVVCVWEGPVVLVEPRQRRAAFLELAAAQLGVEVTVLRGRLEGHGWTGEAAQLSNRQWQVASARAVFDPCTWLDRSGVFGPSTWRTVHVREGWRTPDGWVLGARRRSAHGIVLGVRPECFT